MLSSSFRLVASSMRTRSVVASRVLAFSTIRPNYNQATEEGRKVFVGNLNYKLNNNSLRQFMEGYGEVQDVWIVKDRDTGKSKGYGFVTFGTQEEAEAATGANGQNLQGRTISVNLARPRTLANTVSHDPSAQVDA